MGTVDHSARSQPCSPGPCVGCTHTDGEPPQDARIYRFKNMGTPAKRMTHSIWAIGDLQGCCTPLQQLLSHPDITQDENCQFWFAGDLINRGPNSLQTVRRVMALGDRAVSVLGNHDLHLLAVHAGIRKPSKSDTFFDILTAPDAEDILHWLRHRPLVHYAHGHLL